MTEFISENKFKTFPVFGGKGYTTERIIEDGKNYIQNILKKRDEDMKMESPWAIEA